MKRVVPMLKSLAAAASVSIATCDSVLFVMCCQKSAGFRVSDGEGPRVGPRVDLILIRPSVVELWKRTFVARGKEREPRRF